MANDRSRYLVELMRRSLSAYEKGSINLPALVRDLETLVDSLDEFAEEEWVGELRSLWWQLEVVNAVALAEHRHALTEEERLAVRDAIEGLTAMTTHY